MKTFMGLFIAVLLCVTASAAVGAQRNSGEIYNIQVFNQYTGGPAVRYSSPIKTDVYTLKQVVFAGYSTNGTDMLTNLPGTAVAQCGPTSNGPWVTNKDEAGNATSATTSTLFNILGMCQWMRYGWTKTGTGKRSLSAWIIFGPSN
jgi:hypothetical protein